MIRGCEDIKYVNIGGPHGRLCLKKINLYVQFLVIVLIFFDPNHYITPCPMNKHQKTRVQSFKISNIYKFLLDGVINVTNA
jgi:hypothetical protein